MCSLQTVFSLRLAISTCHHIRIPDMRILRRWRASQFVQRFVPALCPLGTAAGWGRNCSSRYTSTAASYPSPYRGNGIGSLAYEYPIRHVMLQRCNGCGGITGASIETHCILLSLISSHKIVIHQPRQAWTKPSIMAPSVVRNDATPKAPCTSYSLTAHTTANTQSKNTKLRQTRSHIRSGRKPSVRLMPQPAAR